MCEDFFSNFGDKRIGCCITTTHRLTFPFSTGTISDQKQDDCCLPPSLLFSVSTIEDKTERPPFWHNKGDRGRRAVNENYSRQSIQITVPHNCTAMYTRLYTTIFQLNKKSIIPVPLFYKQHSLLLAVSLFSTPQRLLKPARASICKHMLNMRNTYFK
jgi:hypothetical protein